MTTGTDPVCGKHLQQGEAVAEIEHDMQTYVFCSEECRSRFVDNPEQFGASPLPPVCGNCGKEISQVDVVCAHCGTSLVAG